MSAAAKPKITILNSSSFGKHFPDQLEALSAMGPVNRVDVPIDVPDEVLVERLLGTNALIASVTPKLPGHVLEALPDLVLIARHGIGCDNVDIPAATELGIMVSKVAGEVEQEAVAENTIALLLAVGRHVHSGFISVRESRWSERAKYLGLELKGKRIGIIGIGNIGSRVAQILKDGFRAEVIATDPYLSDAEIKRRGATPVAIEELLSTSLAISFHCPLTSATRRLLNRGSFSTMKRGVIIVNSCRGELLDEDALCEALESGLVGAYGTDVVEGEPINGNHRLLKYPNVLVVPHLGGYTTESLSGMGQTMVDDVRKVFIERGHPGTLANPEVMERERRKWG